MNTAPNRAVPKAPPSERKKVTAAVAAPIWTAGTAFCTDSTITCMVMPMPAPSTTT